MLMFVLYVVLWMFLVDVWCVFVVWMLVMVFLLEFVGKQCSYDDEWQYEENFEDDLFDYDSFFVVVGIFVFILGFEFCLCLIFYSVKWV